MTHPTRPTVWLKPVWPSKKKLYWDYTIPKNSIPEHRQLAIELSLLQNPQLMHCSVLPEPTLRLE